jgi:hypothetical protein
MASFRVSHSPLSCSAFERYGTLLPNDLNTSGIELINAVGLAGKYWQLQDGQLLHFCRIILWQDWQDLLGKFGWTYVTSFVGKQTLTEVLMRKHDKLSERLDEILGELAGLEEHLTDLIDWSYSMESNWPRHLVFEGMVCHLLSLVLCTQAIQSGEPSTLEAIIKEANALIQENIVAGLEGYEGRAKCLASLRSRQDELFEQAKARIQRERQSIKQTDQGPVGSDSSSR